MLYTWNTVVGYSNDPDCKKNFLKETRRFLQTIGGHLIEYPLIDLHANKGGIAVSGEIYAKWKIADGKCIEAWMEQSVTRAIGEVLFCARISEYKIEKKGIVRIEKMGMNVYFDPYVTAGQMADKLRGLVNGKGFHLRSTVINPDGSASWNMAYGEDTEIEPNELAQKLGPEFIKEGEPITGTQMGMF